MRQDRELERMDRWHRGLEDELAKERAEALGRSGRDLDEAIADYYAAGPDEDLGPYLDRIADRLYPLVLQRESIGLVVGNLAYLRAAYDIPTAALARFGAVR